MINSPAFQRVECLSDDETCISHIATLESDS